jgi:hypothetical protein
MHDADASEPTWVTDWSGDAEQIDDPAIATPHHSTVSTPSTTVGSTPVDPVRATVPAQEPVPEEAPRSHRRGGGYLALGVLIAIAFAAHYTVLKAPTASSASEKAAIAQLAKPRQGSAQGLAAVTTTLDGAQAYQATHGTYAGWPAPPSADALGTQMDLIYAQSVNGTCYYATVFPGQSPAPAADPTNLECSPAVAAQHRQAAQAMAAIGVTGSATSTSPGSSLGSVAASLPLEQAGTAAQLDAQGAHPSANPTFPVPLTISVPGVRVVTSSATSATLQSTGSGACLQVTLSPSGAIPAPTPC